MYVYDEECYPNVWLFGAVHVGTGLKYVFEISDRRDDRFQLFAFIEHLKLHGEEMVGFNTIGYDYPVLHDILNNINYITPSEIYRKSDGIIKSEDRFGHIIWDRDMHVKQIDLYKIHHFDNKARAVGLKVLEFAMRLDNIEDLPYEPGKYLQPHEIDHLRDYMFHDIFATNKFLEHSKDAIKLRREITEKFGKNFMNHNDTKIGKDYFLMELEKAGFRVKNVRTNRPFIDLNDVILPYVKFERPEFNEVLTWLRSQQITETKGVFKNLKANIDGFEFVFGLGGIHGSIESKSVYSDDNMVIIDLDVASYYPNLAIQNKVFPAHFGLQFCDTYENVYNTRKSYAKGTAENGVYKLALNGVYGDSNNQYSSFYDPQYTMTITINGQMLLCMFAEQAVKIDGLQLIQANTDGITVRLPRNKINELEAIRTWWQNLTKLELEEAIYDAMHIRDVNNYIAVYEGGKKVKRKGAYGHSKDLAWHQNHSMQVVAKAAEAALVHGRDIREFIYTHDDFYDFMMCVKVPRSSKLLWGDNKVQNVSRYYISINGAPLTKMMPPLAKNGPDAPWRAMSVNKGYTVTVCNDIKHATRDNLNYEFYVAEAEKLVNPLRGIK